MSSRPLGESELPCSNSDNNFGLNPSVMERLVSLVEVFPYSLLYRFNFYVPQNLTLNYIVSLHSKPSTTVVCSGSDRSLVG